MTSNNKHDRASLPLWLRLHANQDSRRKQLHPGLSGSSHAMMRCLGARRLAKAWICIAFMALAMHAVAERMIGDISDGWRFVRQDVKGAEEPGFNDASWERIPVPHNWGYVEAQKGNTNYYRGPGWYRRVLDFDFKKDRRYFIRFEAASSVADVYVNGVLVGQHRGGFSAFCHEMTPHLDFDGVNVLAVRVSNEKRDDVLPLAGDFNIYGGIYRPVRIIEKPMVCFDPRDHGSSGVAWLQTEVSSERAVVDLTAWVSNGSEDFIPFTWFPPEPGEIFPEARRRLVARILDDRGNCVAEQQTLFNLGKEASSPHELRLIVDEPHLWQGIDDPYLYTAEVELYTEGGSRLDRLENRIGLRSFKVDPDTGFYLNGKPYRIKGVCRHQDRLDKGWALADADMEEDLALILEMGANAVRLSHYQQSGYFHQLCDEKGVLLYAEIPLVNTFGTNPAIYENARAQMLDLVRQNMNHCSIFAWGLFNELGLKGMDPLRCVHDLNKLVKAEDPTRLTVAATHNPVRPQLNKITDILGWNRYPGWYDPMDHLLDFDMWDKYKATSRRGGMAFSEYGAGANIEQHEQNPGQPVPGGFWHPEEWQALVHENHWACFGKKPYVWGSFAWCMFDFCSAHRKEGGKLGLNDKGLVTFDHKVKKDAYFFYRANWSESPVLHLTGKRHRIRNEQLTPVKVYSNRGPVKLIVNEKTIGTVEPTETMICKWDDIPLVMGENAIRVEANGLADEVTWTYDPHAKSEKPAVEKSERSGGDGETVE